MRGVDDRDRRRNGGAPGERRRCVVVHDAGRVYPAERSGRVQRRGGMERLRPADQALLGRPLIVYVRSTGCGIYGFDPRRDRERLLARQHASVRAPALWGRRLARTVRVGGGEIVRTAQIDGKVRTVPVRLLRVSDLADRLIGRGNSRVNVPLYGDHSEERRETP
jgi:hypothetical protein